MKRSKDINYFNLLYQQLEIIEHMLVRGKELGGQSLHRALVKSGDMDSELKKVQELHVELWISLRNEFLPPMNREDIFQLSSQIQELSHRIFTYIGLKESNKVNTYKQEENKLLQDFIEMNKIHKVIIKEMEYINKSKILDNELIKMMSEGNKVNIKWVEVINSGSRYGVDSKDVIIHKEKLHLLKDILYASEKIGNTIQYIVLRNT